jgi:hypothetical protein
MKGRHEEARVILQRLHDDHDDTLFWEKEYLQISAQLAAEAEETAGHSWLHIFTNPRELRRVAVAVAAMTSVQTNGAQTIQIYQVCIPICARRSTTDNYSLYCMLAWASLIEQHS